MGMEPVRPLRDVFAGLADQAAAPEDVGSSAPDPRSFLAEYGDLPDDLLATAIGSYASTAPAEVAEHLARFVAAPGVDPAEGLNLLASAPVGAWEGEVDLPDAAAVQIVDDENLDDEYIGADDESGLDLDDLGSADSLDLDGTDGEGFREIEDDIEDDTSTLDAGTTSGVAIDGEYVLVPEPGSGVPTAVDHPDMPDDDVDSHYLDEQITDQPTEQPTDLDELDDLQEFDEFDA